MLKVKSVRQKCFIYVMFTLVAVFAVDGEGANTAGARGANLTFTAQ